MLGADSFLDAVSLAWLYDNDKLKASENPIGVAPGEAAACVLLESKRAAEQRRAPIDAVVDAVAIDPARGLTYALRRALEPIARAGATDVNLISDVDGQPWRALELANLMANCAGLFGEARWTAPAVCLGHIGAASALVGICVAVRSYVRDYAFGSRAIVLASSEGGQAGAVCVSSGRR